MKNFLKNWLKKISVTVLIVFVAAASLRLYNFSNRVTFWSEQARSLITSAKYINEKPSLLGQEYFRQNSYSHTLYSSALFNYSLVPLILVANYDPVKITFYFAFLNLFTGLIVYFVVKKIWNESAAIISSTLFLFNDYMIYHSLFIWNYNYLPLIGLLIFYFSYQFFKNNKFNYIFLLGLFSGIGIGLQILFIPFAVLTLLINIWKSKNKIIHSIYFVSGLLIGNFPMVLFDLRHDFYHLKTAIGYFLDTLAGRSDANFAYYYLLPLWPILAIFLGVWVSRIKSRFILLILATYLLMNLISPKIEWTKSTGMPDGLTVEDIDSLSLLIAKDSPDTFNVASVIDFDKRNYVLRYFLEFKYDKKPMPVDDYKNINTLYVLSQMEYNFIDSGVWEIKSNWPYKVVRFNDVTDDLAVYKLEK